MAVESNKAFVKLRNKMENWETLDLIIDKWYLLEDSLKSVQIIEIIDLDNIIVKPYNGEQFKVSQTAFCDYDEE